MDEQKDELQIKIDTAKSQLSDETLSAINAVDWKNAILGMRNRLGYSFEQLGELETETELLLCGLIRPEDYPKELEKRMGISGSQTNDLVREMNQQIFAKIKEEMVKITEQKNNSAKKEPSSPLPKSVPIELVSHDSEEDKKNNAQVLDTAGIEILNGNDNGKNLPTSEKLEITGKIQPPTPSILTQKLSAPVQTATIKTEHSLENLTKPSRPLSEATAPSAPTAYPKNGDPYRLPPE
jgi:hypothetical protein